MLGKTHITLGIASSLIITQPETVSGVIGTMVGGAIGGWIVDVDCKKVDADQERGLDSIIDGLFIGALITVDYLLGNGMCQYIQSNWGFQIWGALIGFIVLILIGFNTKHRTFTHSLSALLLFGVTMYFFCRPIAITFVIGYASHLVADLFNKKGIQVLYPIKWRPCLNLCLSNGIANKTLFWVALGLDVLAGSFFFATAMVNSPDKSMLISNMHKANLFGMNALQLHLLFINTITFLGFQRSWKMSYREEDKSQRIVLEFETWFLDFLVLIGGGIGMLVALLIHLRYPSGYNGNWWSFCYTSILFWFTIYCYIWNPFDATIYPINWWFFNHIPLLAYLVGINLLSACAFYYFRKRNLKEYSLVHTFLFLLGALGGTMGGFVTAIRIHRDNSFNYAVIGFPVMIISQVVFIIYMMSIRVF